MSAIWRIRDSSFCSVDRRSGHPRHWFNPRIVLAAPRRGRHEPNLSYTREIWLTLRDAGFRLQPSPAPPAHPGVRAGAHAHAARWVECGAAGEFHRGAGGVRVGGEGGGAGGDEPRECVAVARARGGGEFCRGVGGGAGAWRQARRAGDCSTTEDHARRAAKAGFGGCFARGDARWPARLDRAEN